MGAGYSPALRCCAHKLVDIIGSASCSAAPLTLNNLVPIFSRESVFFLRMRGVSQAHGGPPGFPRRPDCLSPIPQSTNWLGRKDISDDVKKFPGLGPALSVERDRGPQREQGRKCQCKRNRKVPPQPSNHPHATLRTCRSRNKRVG